MLTENESIQKPERWIIYDDNRFSKDLGDFYEWQMIRKHNLFVCLTNSYVFHSVQQKHFEFQISNLIFKNKIETYLVFLYSFVSILSNLESTVSQKFCCEIFDFQKTIATRHSLQKEWTYFSCVMSVGSHVTWRVAPNPSILIDETDFQLFWPLKWSSQRQMAQNMFHFLILKKKSWKPF